MDMTNAAAIGYMILAAKDLALDKEIIRSLESEMKRIMEQKNEEEAENAYNNFI